MRLNIPVQRVETALTPRTPEKCIVGESGGRSNAIRRTSGSCRQIAKQIDIRIENSGEFIVFPERVKLRQIGDIKTLLIQATVVENRLQVIDDRIDIPMHLVERRLILTVTPVPTGNRSIEPWINIYAPQANHAEWLSDHIGSTHRLPETNFETDLGRITAETCRTTAWIWRVLLIQRRQRHPGNSQGEHAGPADIRDGIGELAFAGDRESWASE